MPQVTIEVSMKLLSDAEPGIGLGTELLNDLVPVNTQDHPFIPATHIKGLARQAWRDLASIREWPAWLEGHLFGQPGTNGAPDRLGAIRFRDLVSPQPRSRATSTISRTRISEHGTVAAGSLRSNECVLASTEFGGAILVSAPPDSLEHQAACLTLLAIDAIGGGRTRGAGRVLTTIANQSARPSAYLRKVDELARKAKEPAPTIAHATAASSGNDAAELLVLTFDADTPVCCPQSPLASGTNVIVGGFYIPASAVQGGLLTAISELDPALASACFASSAFRAWPLLPCSLPGKPTDNTLPIYTSTTHRISKIPDPSTQHHRFADSVLHKYAPGQEPANSPLKGADGVLLSAPSGVSLWRSAEMPRVFAAHVGLGNDEPALFTTQSMAPLTYRGLISVPQALANRIRELLGSGLVASFGRNRTVRGLGRLRASPPPTDWRTFIAELAGRAGVPAFIVHSPILVPNHSRHEPAGAALKRVVEAAGWGTVDEAHANLTCSFGWNRTVAKDLVGDTRRIRAAVTIAPGSVFRLAAAPPDLPAKLVKGLGEGRERGFGAVLPHPGIARELYASPATPTVLKSTDDAGMRANKLIDQARDSGLTPSQISDLISRLEHGRKTLSDRLAKMRSTASPRSWERWKSVCGHLSDLCNQSSVSDDCLKRILKGWHDHAVATGTNTKEWSR
jgi:CRISPR/Cas system CSM-associated protein Csm3 (group 7 of RAMP superfamily)